MALIETFWRIHKNLAISSATCTLFSKEETSAHPDLVLEGSVAELGNDFRRLSNPDWFVAFAQSLIEWEVLALDKALSQGDTEGIPLYLRDLESYRQVRFVDSGARYALMAIDNPFLPPDVRKHPTLNN